MNKKRRFEMQLLKLSLIPSVPLFLLLLWVMIYSDISIWLTILVGFIGAITISYTAYYIFHKTVFQFRSLNNLLEAMIHGEYSLRASPDHPDGALNELVVSINGLAERLSRQRWEASENQLLVQTIIEHIDVAIVAFTDDDQISFLNPAAEKLLNIDSGALQTTIQAQLASVKKHGSGGHQVIELPLGHQRGSFNVHVEEFRKSGKQHRLVFISDVTRLLRQEERKAWQDLVRVISHEINNSLSPIASISQTLRRQLTRKNNSGLEETGDLTEGLTIISERAKALGQFVDSYKQLTKLPEPQAQAVSLAGLFDKITALFSDQEIIVETEGDIELFLDPIQFEQVLINLVKNAKEAMAQSNPEGCIRIAWQAFEGSFKLMLSDEGQGIRNPGNIFVPFYSTKKNGSGIGLVFCRQIIEAHNGRLTLSNIEGGKGCRATIELPLER